MQHQGVFISATLIDFDENWLNQQLDIINTLKTIWNNDLYKVKNIIYNYIKQL